MQNRTFKADEIIDFYNETAWEYRFFWSDFNLHYGFYDDEHTTHRAAMENSNRIYADKLGVDDADTVLDIGTGRGGFPTHVAATTDADVHGIDIDPVHLRDARENARQRGVEASTTFSNGDYHNIPYPDDAFDAVSGIETVCHSDRKERVLREVRRVLKPGGRIMISDGYMNRSTLSEEQERKIRTMLDGWAVPDLAHVSEFWDLLEELGFTDISFDDHYERIVPSSRRQWWLSLGVTPLLGLASALGLKSDSSVDQGVTLFHQREIIEEGLAIHGDFTAKLPD